MSEVPTLYRRVADLAARVSAGVRGLSLIALVAAVWLWSVILYPFAFSHWWGWLPAVLLLSALAAPGAILLAVHMALRELIRLPTRVRGAGESSVARAGRAAESVRARPRWWLPRTAWELWRLVVENRELLVAYSGLVRLVNPVSLAVIGAAAFLAVLLIVAGGIAGLVVAL